MARQKKVVACGSTLTALGMVLKFVAGPAAMAMACLAVGLHGDVLRVAIIQVNTSQYYKLISVFIPGLVGN